jgi:PST family polysaccharide transporter
MQTTDYLSIDSVNTDLKKRAIRGGGASISARSADFLLQLCGTLLLARILTPEDFGLIAMVTAVTGFFLIFKDLGLTEATIQSAKITHEQVSTLFWINVAFCILIATLISLFSPLLADFFKEPRLKLITIVSSSSFIFAGFTNQHMALLRRQMHFYRIAIIEIIAVLVGTAITVIFALQSPSYWALVARPVIQACITCCGAWIACSWRPGLPVRNADIGGMIKFGANALGFFCVNYFARNLDKALVGWRSGADVLGNYSRAYYLFIAPINQFCIPLHGVAVTTLSKLRNNTVQFRKFYFKALTAISFVGMPLSTFLAAMGRELILLLLGPKWISATGIFMIFGLSSGVLIISGTNSWLHVSLGRTDRWFRWGIFSTIITALFFVCGLPFGATGVALGYTLSLYLLTVPAICYAGKPAGLTISRLCSEIWRYYVAAAFAGISVWYIAKILLISNLLLKLLIGFCAFSFLYLAVLILLYGGFSPIIQFLDIVKTMISSKNKQSILNQNEKRVKNEIKKYPKR